MIRIIGLLLLGGVLFITPAIFELCEDQICLNIDV